MKTKLTLVLIFSMAIAHAQIIYKLPKKNKDFDISGKTILVELLEPDVKTLSKMTEKDATEFKQEVEAMNELRRECLNKYWTLKNPLVFKPISEISAMPEESLKNFLWFEENRFTPRDVMAEPNNNTVAYTYSLGCGDDFNLSFSIGNRAETAMDYKFVIYNLCKYAQGYIDRKPLLDPSLYNKQKNFATLQKKTLLLTKDMLNTEKFSEQKAIEMYPHKVKFTTSDDIYTAMENEDTTALFFTYVYNASFVLWTYAIVDVASMDVIALQAPNRVHFSVGAKQDYVGMHTPSRDRQNALIIWRSRVNIQLDERDFKYLGQQGTVNRNYLNPLSGLK